MLLKETWSSAAARAAYQTQWPIDNVWQHQIGYLDIVGGQVKFGQSLFGIEDAIGMVSVRRVPAAAEDSWAASPPLCEGALGFRAHRFGAVCPALRAHLAGSSRTTLSAGLSSRSPWNEGCRKRPSRVH